jgi:hypothetical protein
MIEGLDAGLAGIWRFSFIRRPRREASSLGPSGALKFRVIITPMMLMSGKYSAE